MLNKSGNLIGLKACIMKEETISRIAVVILSVVLAVFGVYHLLYPNNMINFIPDFLSKDSGRIMVYIAGIAIILAAIAFLTHRQVRLAGYLLAVLMILVVVLFHIPNYMNAGDPDLKTSKFIDILQDSSLAAFAMYIASNAKKI